MRKTLMATMMLVGLAAAAISIAPQRSDATPAAAGSDSQAGSASGSKPLFRKVLIIVLENTGYEAAIKQPFLASLAHRGALLSSFYAETHPSQPNYIALVSGSTHGVTGDGKVTIDARQVGDLLEGKGLAWKVYAEDYPGNCFLGAWKGGYVRKHVPFLSFKDVQTRPGRCARIVPATQLARDIRAGTLPDYSLYIPNRRNDGHDTSVSFADRWLSKTFGPLLQDPGFTAGLLLVVTFDEGPRSSSNRILTVLFGDSVKPGSVSKKTYNHYSLLRLVEDQFGLGHLQDNDRNASVITGIWK